MAEYIEREAFLAMKRHLYCENCARRKGMKNGKFKVLYEIGGAPCRACGINDVLEDVEDYPDDDVVPVVRQQKPPKALALGGVKERKVMENGANRIDRC